MKNTENTNIVSYVLRLFNTLVLLVAWPIGKKGCKGVDFTKISLKDMMDPDYRRRLAEGNIGVVQGAASGGIGSIDIDDEEGVEEFLTLNPDLRETLRTRGARGCNVWFYPEGDVPRSGRLKRNGQPWGEWRFDGCQTIIAGIHPSGVPYTFLCANPAIRYPFERIQFPPGVTARFIHDTPSITTDTRTAPKRTEPEKQNRTKPQTVVSVESVPSVHSPGGQELDQQTLEKLLKGTIPTGIHTNHDKLFLLARGVKTLEMERSLPLSDAELRRVFSLWHERASAFLRPDQSWDEYFYEFTEAHGDVIKPIGEAVVDVAWRAVNAANYSLPPEATLFVDGRLKKLVGLCHLMQALAGSKPFYLACRTVQRIYDLRSHEQAAMWLRILRQQGVLSEAIKGGPDTMKATRYYYQNACQAQGKAVQR